MLFSTIFFLGGEMAYWCSKMDFIGMTRRTKEEIEIHKELMIIQSWKWTTRKEF